jgi:CRISPR-associated protein Csd2
MNEESSIIAKRYDFVLLFDVQDGNPNGDPDAGNLPRSDPETGQGLVTDVCLKRKIRNYVQLSKRGAEGYDIYVKEKAVLNTLIAAAYADLKIDLEAAPKNRTDGAKRKTKGEGQGGEVESAGAWMCRRYYDVRTFGAVLSTGANAGQVRGPVQLTFARSIDPIYAAEHAITRMAVATQAEADRQGGDNRTMGRKNTVPYGLYKGHGFVSAALAHQTHFTQQDLALLWDAIRQMFEHDRSAARGLMSLRDLIVFEHESELGNAPAHKLFERVTVKRKDENKLPRDFSDYVVSVGELPAGVQRLTLG